jgi:predicted metal-dependent peptidase
METSTIISKARTRLMLEQPFFGAMAMTLKMIEDDSISTMCTDGKSIRYNPEFVQMHSFDEILGVVAHEVMHVAFCHMTRRGEYNHKIWNMATDYAINPIVLNAGMKLPESGLFEPQFAGMSSEMIYQRLINQENPPDPPEGWDFGGVIQAPSESGEALSDEEAKQIEEDIRINVLQAYQAAKQAGKAPAGIEDMIKDISSPRVDWRDKMHLFVGGDQPDDYTFSRCNRKWIQHGIYMPAVNHFGAGHVVAVADTSRSVNTEMLAQFLGELNAISQDMKPLSVTVISCDTKVQAVHRYEQGDPIEMLDAKGRGGTRVTPAFNYVRDHNLPVDSFIYFTDLEVWDFPEEPDYPVLWVSTGQSDAPFGDVVMARS